MFQSKAGGPEGFPWQVVGEDGTPVAACSSESVAERVAFLLGTWKGGGAAALGARTVSRDGVTARAEILPASLVRATPEGAPAPVPGPFPAPEDPRPTAAPATVPGSSWEACGGLVEAMEGGAWQVTFPERPRLHVRDALKAAGFRWNGVSWRGYRLPASFLPAAAPAGGVA